MFLCVMLLPALCLDRAFPHDEPNQLTFYRVVLFEKCNLAMLYRNIGGYIGNHFKMKRGKILVLEGTRQIWKSYIISPNAQHIKHSSIFASDKNPHRYTP